ncbi:tigger transposable element-derived protein 1-like [Trichogramma pretiosum]|uniref:tigger transposable element-derived protein 1-like n=1 Tax=Trichogramma pretiosum TaxID=7493 RepID=UPI000C71BC87|nr:tigger transposable element-derived protein 1-like [Trichogramma pretiosum]
MAPSKNPSKTPSKTPLKTPCKRNRKVLNLADKMKIISLIDDGEKLAWIARRFDVNESTIQTIRDNASKIRESSKNLGQHAQFTKVARSNLIEKVEMMLLIWIQDLMHNKIPISSAAIRDQAIVFHIYLCTKYGKEEAFNASKGWFENFKTRFLLYNVKFTGEIASADHEAAREKKYEPEQIFNCDETGLFWKRMPKRTWLTKEEERAPGFKVAKDRLTLLFCVNASALKGKRKEHLPVYWKANKTAWITKINFDEWFKESFIPEVREFLAQKNLAFKVLLLLDNYQTVIATFKPYYLRRLMKSIVRTVNLHRSRNNFIPENVVRNFWRNFNIMDAINFIQEAWDEVKSTTVNMSWKKILPHMFSTVIDRSELYPEVVQDVVTLTRDVEGEGFNNVEESEILNLILPEPHYSPEEIEELSTEPPADQTDDALFRFKIDCRSYGSSHSSR